MVIVVEVGSMHMPPVGGCVDREPMLMLRDERACAGAVLLGAALAYNVGVATPRPLPCWASWRGPHPLHRLGCFRADLHEVRD